MTTTNGEQRKAVTLVQRFITRTATGLGRLASWIRRDYPSFAPESGYNYLVGPRATRR